MNIKKFRKQLKYEELNIPDVREKVKNSSIFINRKIEQETCRPMIRMKNWLRLGFGTVMAVLLVIFAIVVIDSNNRVIQYESSSINYVKTEAKLNELVNCNNNYSTKNIIERFVNVIPYYSTSDSIEAETFNSKAYVVTTKALDGYAASSSKIVTYNNEVSKTNVQVEGIDEADVVKSDGKKIYRTHDNDILINPIDKGAIGDTVTINLADEEKYYVYGQELYITDEYIIDIFFTYEKITRKEWFTGKYYYGTGEIHINIYDKEGYELKKEYKAEMVNFNDSRLVEGDTDYLYVIFSQSIYTDKKEPVCYIDDSEVKTSLEDVCYFDTFTTNCYTYIVSFKLDESIEVNENVTLGSNDWDCIYFTENSLYLVDEYSEYTYKNYTTNANFVNYSWDDMTSIAKYDIKDGVVTPIASLSTEGETISQFAMDEYNGYFRIVLSIINRNKLEIYKLDKDEDGNYKFVLTGAITKDLGEKNEVVKSVDFNGDTCLVVTAKETDPMYKIDLSDPTNPKIVGKFKEEGYNSYLQYLSGDLEGLAIGVGYLTTDISEYYNIKEQTKFALYDVTKDDPVQLQLITYDTTYMEACYEHKAIFVYKNYVGFEAKGVYYLYEIVKQDKTYRLEERIAYQYNKDGEYYNYSSSRMYYVDGYFYLAYNDMYSTEDSVIVSFNSNYEKLHIVNTEKVMTE